MTFWEYVFATFGGVGLGFVFSIFLFYLTNRWGRNTRRKLLEKNVVKEFEFNEKYLEEVVKKLEEAIQDITVGDKTRFYYFNYRSYQRLFTNAYFMQNFLYEKLNPNDTYKLDLILNRMTIPGEQFMTSLMDKWNSSQIGQQEALKFARLERDSMKSFIKDIGKIKQKIVSK
ncbi:hypothetical protein CEE35_07045 [Candidatus Aerophobetes bacterium Ae_b3b]|nr:MAG: hypothetical protein CEE35_07045 [Candidatus Aerophobetes bacterium Ae_b3b]